jgi:hypothetical protein
MAGRYPHFVRYNHGVRHGIGFLVVGLVACGPKSGPTTVQPPNGGSGSGVVTTTDPGAGSAKPVPPGEAPDIGCLTSTCVFHGGGAGYFTCLAGGNGTCFHFGAACTPADACMFDPTANAYKQCTKPGDGTCLAWGAACAPASKCMYDARNKLHHTCEQVSGGTCARYGALCSP